MVIPSRSCTFGITNIVVPTFIHTHAHRPLSNIAMCHSRHTTQVLFCANATFLFQLHNPEAEVGLCLIEIRRSHQKGL